MTPLWIIFGTAAVVSVVVSVTLIAVARAGGAVIWFIVPEIRGVKSPEAREKIWTDAGRLASIQWQLGLLALFNLANLGLVLVAWFYPRWRVWAVGLLVLVSVAGLLRVRFLLRQAVRRAMSVTTFCFTCGYDLTGNESGVCPECGTEIEKT